VSDLNGVRSEDHAENGNPQASWMLETRGLTKDFKGFTAVKDVNLRVQEGHIHALIGPNGAGKTTFFNLLTKFLTPSAGSIVFNGTDITCRYCPERRDPFVPDFSGFPPSERPG